MIGKCLYFYHPEVNFIIIYTFMITYHSANSPNSFADYPKDEIKSPKRVQRKFCLGLNCSIGSSWDGLSVKDRLYFFWRISSVLLKKCFEYWTGPGLRAEGWGAGVPWAVFRSCTEICLRFLKHSFCVDQSTRRLPSVYLCD